MVLLLFFLLLLHFLTQNMFLTDNETIKLGDFGSACVLNRYRTRKEAIYSSPFVSYCIFVWFAAFIFDQPLVIVFPAQRRMRKHMLGRPIMWLQKSGTTKRTTIRGTLSNLFIRILYARIPPKGLTIKMTIRGNVIHFIDPHEGHLVLQQHEKRIGKSRPTAPRYQ